MTGLRLYAFDVTGVEPMHRGGTVQNCGLPSPDPRFVCTLPVGHQPAGDHEVQVPALVTIIRFRSDLENPMAKTDDPAPDPKREAGKKRAQRGDIAAKPARPRSNPTPRDVRPQAKPDQR